MIETNYVFILGTRENCEGKLFQSIYSSEKSYYSIPTLAPNVSLIFIFIMLSEHINPGKTPAKNLSYYLFPGCLSTCVYKADEKHIHAHRQTDRPANTGLPTVESFVTD